VRPGSRQGRQVYSTHSLRDLGARALSKAINGTRSRSVSWRGGVPASNIVSPPVFGYAPDLTPESRSRRGEADDSAEPDIRRIAMDAFRGQHPLRQRRAGRAGVAQMLDARRVRARVRAFPINAICPEKHAKHNSPRHCSVGARSGRPRVAHTRCQSRTRKRIRSMELVGILQPEGGRACERLRQRQTKKRARRSQAGEMRLPCGITRDSVDLISSHWASENRSRKRPRTGRNSPSRNASQAVGRCFSIVSRVLLSSECLQ